MPSSRRSVIALAIAAASVVCGAVGLAPAPVAAQATSGEGWVRLGHFAPGNGVVDLVVDGKVEARGLSSGAVTPYVRVAAGTHRVQAVPAGGGASVPPVVDVEAGVMADASVTVGVVSTRDGVAAQVYDDSPVPPPAGGALVRFIHTVPDIPAVDIAVVNGPVLASSLAFPDATPYANVTPGTYDVEVRRAGTAEVLVKVAGWTVSAGSEATVVVNRTPTGGLSVVPLLDAGGAATMPAGGAATGFGGMAPPPSAPWLSWIVGLAAATVGSWFLIGRPPRVRPALALVAVVGVTGCGSGRATSSARSTVSPTTAPTPATVSTAVPGSAPTSIPTQAGSPPVVSGANVNAPRVGVPTEVRIPSLGVSSSLVPLGLAPDGTAAVPATADQAGWFTGGPKPGEVGASVILGHVDSHDGPGVFFGLRDIDAGAEVVVSSDAGDRTFVVDRVEQVPKDAFPSAEVYGAVPEAALRLITCGGAFDRATGHYVDNVVVFLHLAATA